MNSRTGKPRRSARDQANSALIALTTPAHRQRYFDGVPIDEMIQICETAGFTVPEGERGMILCGREGKVTVPLLLPSDLDPKHMLVFTWYKMESGRYEVVAYVS